MYQMTNRGLGGSVTGVRLDCAKPLTVDTTSEAKACWCLSFPMLCSTATIQAAQALVNPDQVISPILQPPPIGAVAAGYSNVQVPYPCSDGSMATAAANCPAYSAAIDAVIAEQQRAWQAQNAATIAETQGNLDAIAAANPPFDFSLPSFSIPTWAWFAIAGVGAFALVSAGGGSPRRYGR